MFFANAGHSKAHEQFASNFFLQGAHRWQLDISQRPLLRQLRRLLSAVYRNGGARLPGYWPESAFSSRSNPQHGFSILDGYWQTSETWPGGIAEVVDHIPVTLLDEVFGRAPDALAPRIAIHYRGGDYFQKENSNLLAFDFARYLQSAIDDLSIDAEELVIVTDDPARARQAVGTALAGSRSIQYLCQDPLDDLRVLAGSRKVVTSNSTFSILAAEVARRRGAQCISPRTQNLNANLNEKFLSVGWTRL